MRPKPIGPAVGGVALAVAAGVLWGVWAAALVVAAGVGGYVVGMLEGAAERRRRDRIRIPNAAKAPSMGVIGDPRLRQVVALEEGEGGPVGGPFTAPDANRFLVGTFGMDVAVLGLGLQFSRTDARNLGVHLCALAFDTVDEATAAIAQAMES